jgi:hypothetical protein
MTSYEKSCLSLSPINKAIAPILTTTHRNEDLVGAIELQLY